jgi:hypothetical protein
MDSTIYESRHTLHVMMTLESQVYRRVERRSGTLIFLIKKLAFHIQCLSCLTIFEYKFMLKIKKTACRYILKLEHINQG